MAKQTAFALAGLGGFNAHGAGFLESARAAGCRPALITATSGQIMVVAKYLQEAPDLRAGLIDKAREKNIFAQLTIALTGYPGIFRPAYAEAMGRLLRPFWYSGYDQGGADPDPLGALGPIADRLAPAQQYVPVRSATEIADLVSLFNAKTHLGGAQIGIVFNAYDPVSGEGRLFGNDAARALMKQPANLPIASGSNVPQANLSIAQKPSSATIWPIDAEAIQSALWLTLYGFEGRPGGMIDGAYHRACILSELHIFPRVIVARPLAQGWQDRDLPTNWFEMQDWQCEMWFSAGYKAEVDAMQRINAMIRRLLEAKAVTPEALDALKLREVDLREVPAKTPAGYFNFFIERDEVFESARTEGERLFAKLAVEDERGVS